eukprot:4342630-Amphidinium_carterae.2
MLNQPELPTLLLGAPYNLMCEPGTLLLRGKDPNNIIYVLAAWSHCVVGVTCVNKRAAGVKFSSWALQGDDFLQYRYLRPGEDWRAIELEPLAPSASKHLRLRDSMSSSLQWLVKGDLQTVQQVAAKKGFRHLSAEHMKQVCRSEQVATSGSSVESLVRALVSHYLPDVVESSMQEILVSRGCKIESVTIRTMSEADVQQCRCDMDEAEYEGVLEEVMAESKKRTRRKESEQTSSSNTAAASTAESSTRKPNKLSMSMMSEELSLAAAREHYSSLSMASSLPLQDRAIQHKSSLQRWRPQKLNLLPEVGLVASSGVDGRNVPAQSGALIFQHCSLKKHGLETTAWTHLNPLLNPPPKDSNSTLTGKFIKHNFTNMTNTQLHGNEFDRGVPVF